MTSSYAARVSGQDEGVFTGRTYPLTTGVLRGRLFLSSYAPLFAILAARTAPGIGDRHLPLWPFVVSSSLALVGLADGWWLIGGAKRRGAIRVVPLHVEEQGAAVAGYLPTYLLPFIGLTPNTIGAWLGYGVYLIVLFVVFMSSDFALVNQLCISSAAASRELRESGGLSSLMRRQRKRKSWLSRNGYRVPAGQST